MKVKDSLLLLSFRLLFFKLEEILKRISRFILKNEIKEEQKRNVESSSSFDKMRKKNMNISTENIVLTTRFNRLKEKIKENRNKTLELGITKNKELVVISYSKKKVFDIIELFEVYQ